MDDQAFVLSACDQQNMKEIETTLDNIHTYKKKVSGEKVNLDTVAGGLFHQAAAMIKAHEDEYPNLSKYVQKIDKAVTLCQDVYSSAAEFVLFEEDPLNVVVAAWSGAKIAKDAIHMRAFFAIFKNIENIHKRF